MAEDPGGTIDQASIDELLRQAGVAPGGPNPPPDPQTTAPTLATAAPAGASLSVDDQLASDSTSIDELLRQASFEDPSVVDASAFGAAPAPPGGGGEPGTGFASAGFPSGGSGGFPAAGPNGAPAVPDAARYELPSFQQVMQDAQVSSIDLLRDVELNVKIELGRSRMLVEDVLRLAEGSVVELDKLAGDPVDVFVNDRLVARGEVLVLNDNFCVRVNEIVAGAKEEGL